MSLTYFHCTVFILSFDLHIFVTTRITFLRKWMSNKWKRKKTEEKEKVCVYVRLCSGPSKMTPPPPPHNPHVSHLLQLSQRGFPFVSLTHVQHVTPNWQTWFKRCSARSLFWPSSRPAEDLSPLWAFISARPLPNIPKVESDKRPETSQRAEWGLRQSASPQHMYIIWNPLFTLFLAIGFSEVQVQMMGCEPHKAGQAQTAFPFLPFSCGCYQKPWCVHQRDLELPRQHGMSCTLGGRG